MLDPICISGVGVVSPIGSTLPQFWENAAKGLRGFQSIASINEEIGEEIFLAPAMDYFPENFLSPAQLKITDRFAQMGMVAAKEALQNANCLEEIENNTRAGVLIGTGLGGAKFHEEGLVRAITKGYRAIHPLSVPKITPSSVSAHLATEFRIPGQNLSISTACSSGMNAIGEAYRKVKDGYLDYVLCGGVEAPLTPCNIVAYRQMRVLNAAKDANDIYGPFDENRAGFVLGEAAAMFVVEKKSTALKRGSKIYAEITGFESQCGMHNIAIPDPSAQDIIALMMATIKSTGLRPSEIDAIHTHGTATKQNDEVEALGLKTVFGEALQSKPLISIKALTGHTLGAAGALQIAASLQTFENENLTPISHCQQPIKPWNFITHPTKKNCQTILNNCFGFGSNNTALIVRTPQ